MSALESVSRGTHHYRDGLFVLDLNAVVVTGNVFVRQSAHNKFNHPSVDRFGRRFLGGESANFSSYTSEVRVILVVK